MDSKYIQIFINNEVGCDMSKCGIYAISNIINGHIYIGQTNVAFASRHYGHSKALFDNRHPNKHLQNAYNLYGKESFVFHIIEIVESKDKNEIDNLEIYWIREYRNTLGDRYVYNYSDGGAGGVNPTQEVRDKISYKRKLVCLNNVRCANWYDKTFSDEVQKRRTESTRRYWSDMEVRKAKSEFMKRMYEDPEFCAKMRIAYNSEERSRKISESVTISMSNPETRAHLSELAAQRWSNENERLVQSERRKAYCASERGKAQLKETANRPEMKAMLAKRNKERFQDQAERDNIAEHNRKAWADPEARAKRCENISKAQKKRLSTPEARIKLSEAAKKGWEKIKARKQQSQERHD